MSYGTPAGGRAACVGRAQRWAHKGGRRHSAQQQQQIFPVPASTLPVLARAPGQPKPAVTARPLGTWPRAACARTCLCQQHVELAGHAACHGVHAKPAARGPTLRWGNSAAGKRAARRAALHALSLAPLCASLTKRPWPCRPHRAPGMAGWVLVRARGDDGSEGPARPRIARGSRGCRDSWRSLDLDALLLQPLNQVGDGVLGVGHGQAVAGHDEHPLGCRERGRVV